MNILFGVIIGFLVLMLLVVAHEFGHFIMAKKSGVKVNEFGIGFPPRAIAWVKKDGKWRRIPKKDWDKEQKTLIFSLNWLPIGGFCAMDGESDSDTRPHTFGSTTFWQKTKILFGGVAMNWIVAIIILTILAWTGMPSFVENQFFIPNDANIVTTKPVEVSEVMENSPADEAGFEVGDKIIKVEDQDIISAQDLIDYNQDKASQTVNYTVLRGDEEEIISAELNPADSEYLLGISMSSGQIVTRTTWSAPIVGIVTTAQLTGETFKGIGTLLWNLITGVARQVSFDGDVREQGREDIGKAGDSVSGPVGIIGVLFPAFTSSGPTNLAFLAALISVSLACMNVIPIPALDGGRWLMIAISRLRKKRLTKETEEKIVARSLIVLFVLIGIVTVLDIIRFF